MKTKMLSTTARRTCCSPKNMSMGRSVGGSVLLEERSEEFLRFFNLNIGPRVYTTGFSVIAFIHGPSICWSVFELSFSAILHKVRAL